MQSYLHEIKYYVCYLQAIPIHFSLKIKQEPSAYKTRFDLIAWDMSFTCVRNSKDSGNDPCGTPHVIFVGFE